ncbi:MAG TPA: hypothetical protein DEQ47_14975 [Solibacterales bacterium]|nr:hypothetical protein [Bryobacterales bacterium]
MNRQPNNTFTELLYDSGRVLGLYARGQLEILAWTTALYLAGYALAQVPLWFGVAVISALLGLVPRVGAIVSLVLVLLMGWLGGMSLLGICEAFAVWVVVQGVEGFYLTPKLLGRPLGLTPMAVILSMLLGSLVFGPIGLLLAIPVLAVGLVWVRRLTHAR